LDVPAGATATPYGPVSTVMVSGLDGVNPSADAGSAGRGELLMPCGLHNPLHGPVVDPRRFGRCID